jgi:glycosyltransferase involved in cell wall biosynthesis
VRVVALRRQRFGGIATLTNLLRDPLDRLGVEFIVDDADEWIPNETGHKTDRSVAKQVREAKKGFDLVHAFGYRAAWACSAAFGRELWVYTAHDMPKTTHPKLIENLNYARVGVCSSEAVRQELETAGTKKLQTIVPGLPTDRRVMDRDQARKMLAVQDDMFLVVCAGAFNKEHSLDTAIHVMAALPYFCRLIVSGKGEEEQHLRSISNERTVITTEPFSQQQAIAAADLVLVPSTKAGFSYTAIEAMLQGTAVAMRRIDGLKELAQDRQTAFYFDTDEECLDLLNHLCFKRIEVHEVGRAAREHVLNAFDIEKTAQALKLAYTQALA